MSTDSPIENMDAEKKVSSSNSDKTHGVNTTKNDESVVSDNPINERSMETKSIPDNGNGEDKTKVAENKIIKTVPNDITDISTNEGEKSLETDNTDISANKVNEAEDTVTKDNTDISTIEVNEAEDTITKDNTDISTNKVNEAVATENKDSTDTSTNEGNEAEEAVTTDIADISTNEGETFTIDNADISANEGEKSITDNANTSTEAIEISGDEIENVNDEIMNETLSQINSESLPNIVETDLIENLPSSNDDSVAIDSDDDQIQLDLDLSSVVNTLGSDSDNEIERKKSKKKKKSKDRSDSEPETKRKKEKKKKKHKDKDREKRKHKMKPMDGNVDLSNVPDYRHHFTDPEGLTEEWLYSLVREEVIYSSSSGQQFTAEAMDMCMEQLSSLCSVALKKLTEDDIIDVKEKIKRKDPPFEDPPVEDPLVEDPPVEDPPVESRKRKDDDDDDDNNSDDDDDDGESKPKKRKKEKKKRILFGSSDEEEDEEATRQEVQLLIDAIKPDDTPIIDPKSVISIDKDHSINNEKEKTTVKEKSPALVVENPKEIESQKKENVIAKSKVTSESKISREKPKDKDTKQKKDDKVKSSKKSKETENVESTIKTQKLPSFKIPKKTPAPAVVSVEEPIFTPKEPIFTHQPNVVRRVNRPVNKTSYANQSCQTNPIAYLTFYDAANLEDTMLTLCNQLREHPEVLVNWSKKPIMSTEELTRLRQKYCKDDTAPPKPKITLDAYKQRVDNRRTHRRPEMERMQADSTEDRFTKPRPSTSVSSSQRDRFGLNKEDNRRPPYNREVNNKDDVRMAGREDRPINRDEIRLGGRDDRPINREEVRMGNRDGPINRDDRNGGRDDRPINREEVRMGNRDGPINRDDRNGGRDDRPINREEVRMGNRDGPINRDEIRMSGRDDRLINRDEIRMVGRDDRGGRDDRPSNSNREDIRIGSRDERPSNGTREDIRIGSRDERPSNSNRDDIRIGSRDERPSNSNRDDIRIGSREERPVHRENRRGDREENRQSGSTRDRENRLKINQFREVHKILAQNKDNRTNIRVDDKSIKTETPSKSEGIEKSTPKYSPASYGGDDNHNDDDDAISLTFDDDLSTVIAPRITSVLEVTPGINPFERNNPIVMAASKMSAELFTNLSTGLSFLPTGQDTTPSENNVIINKTSPDSTDDIRKNEKEIMRKDEEERTRKKEEELLCKYKIKCLDLDKEIRLLNLKRDQLTNDYENHLAMRIELERQIAKLHTDFRVFEGTIQQYKQQGIEYTNLIQNTDNVFHHADFQKRILNIQTQIASLEVNKHTCRKEAEIKANKLQELNGNIVAIEQEANVVKEKISNITNERISVENQEKELLRRKKRKSMNPDFVRKALTLYNFTPETGEERFFKEQIECLTGGSLPYDFSRDTCFNVLNGKTCNYSPNCKFKHELVNVKEIMNVMTLDDACNLYYYIRKKNFQIYFEDAFKTLLEQCKICRESRRTLTLCYEIMLRTNLYRPNWWHIILKTLVEIKGVFGEEYELELHKVLLHVIHHPECNDVLRNYICILSSKTYSNMLIVLNELFKESPDYIIPDDVITQVVTDLVEIHSKEWVPAVISLLLTNSKENGWKKFKKQDVATLESICTSDNMKEFLLAKTCKSEPSSPPPLPPNPPSPPVPQEDLSAPYSPSDNEPLPAAIVKIMTTDFPPENVENLYLSLCNALKKEKWDEMIKLLKMKGKLSRGRILYHVIKECSTTNDPVDVYGNLLAMTRMLQLLNNDIKNNDDIVPFFMDIHATVGINLLFDIVDKAKTKLDFEAAFKVLSELEYMKKFDFSKVTSYRDEPITPIKVYKYFGRVSLQMGLTTCGVDYFSKAHKGKSSDPNDLADFWEMIGFLVEHFLTRNNFDSALNTYLMMNKLISKLKNPKPPAFCKEIVYCAKNATNRNTVEDMIKLWRIFKEFPDSISHETTRAFLIYFYSVPSAQHLLSEVYSTGVMNKTYSVQYANTRPRYINLHSYLSSEEIFVIIEHYLQESEFNTSPILGNSDLFLSIKIEVMDSPAPSELIGIGQVALIPMIDSSLNAVSQRVKTALQQIRPPLIINNEAGGILRVDSVTLKNYVLSRSR